MPLPKPTYVPTESIADPVVDHTWSEWDPIEVLAAPDEETQKWLSRTSNRGICAFAIGCAEWVVYRFSGLSSDDTPYKFLEACWLCIFGGSDRVPPESEEEEWQGPIRGAIDFAQMTVLNVWNQGEFGPPVKTGALSAQIALHVLRDKTQFLDWQDKVLKRLAERFPRDEENPDGVPIPREIMDPARDISPEHYSQFILDSLATIDFESNQFIES